MKHRLNYYRKDIIELLAGRAKAEVAADFERRNMLDENQLKHFVTLDDPVQSYTYLIDAILVAGHIVAEKFTDTFWTLM